MRSISPSFLDMLPAEKQPSKKVSLVAVEDEGCGMERYLVPDLKRAASVSIPVRSVAGKHPAGLGKPSFKIELPPIDLFSASVSSQGLISFPSTPEITTNGGANTQTDAQHLSCATDCQAKLLPTPPPERPLPSYKTVSPNKDHRDSAANKRIGGSIHQMQNLAMDSESQESADPCSASNITESRPAADSSEGANTTPLPLDVGFQDTGRPSSYLDKAIEVVRKFRLPFSSQRNAILRECSF